MKEPQEAVIIGQPEGTEGEDWHLEDAEGERRCLTCDRPLSPGETDLCAGCRDAHPRPANF